MAETCKLEMQTKGPRHLTSICPKGVLVAPLMRFDSVNAPVALEHTVLSSCLMPVMHSHYAYPWRCAIPCRSGGTRECEASCDPSRNIPVLHSMLGPMHRGPRAKSALKDLIFSIWEEDHRKPAGMM